MHQEIAKFKKSETYAVAKLSSRLGKTTSKTGILKDEESDDVPDMFSQEN